MSGTGKTTLATALAESLSMRFIEGDSLHPKCNIEKMSNGIPLTDEDRQPWLELVKATAEQYALENSGDDNGGADNNQGEGCGVVITCSALKRCYRDLLRGRNKDAFASHSDSSSKSQSSLSTYFVFIKGDRDTISKRMERREGHYMKADMLDSQFDDLESPEGEDGVVVVNAEDTTEQQVEKAKEGITAILALRK